MPPPAIAAGSQEHERQELSRRAERRRMAGTSATPCEVRLKPHSSSRYDMQSLTQLLAREGGAMRSMRFRSRGYAALALAAAFAATAAGQVNLPSESIGGPLTSQPVMEAPFTADATTTVYAIMRDGTRLDQSMTDRYYRDSLGRVRIERHMEGLPAPKTVSERHSRTMIAPDPSRWPDVYTVDEETSTARLLPPLGTKRIAGVEATGRRVTIVVPPGYRHYDQWTEMVDERWESTELQLLIQSRHSDPRRHH